MVSHRIFLWGLKPFLNLFQATILEDIETQCEGTVKDVQYNFYGTSVAVCDTAGKVQIIDQTQPQGISPRFIFIIEASIAFPHAHSGVVAGVDWTHPE